MKRIYTFIWAGALVMGGIALPKAVASDAGMPSDPEAMFSKSYTAKGYSPYAQRGFPVRPLWGDTHLHTMYSMDAGAFGNRLGLDEAYRFARGEEVMASSGQAAKLSRPLDWLVIADHSDNMGWFPDLFAGKSNILSDPTGKDWYDRIQKGEGVSVALDVIKNFSQGTFPEDIYYWPDSKAFRTAWTKTIDAAERFNDPGKFTAFIGFEWTTQVKGDNLHRVVMFRDDANKASQTIAYTTVAPQGSPDPRDLWKYMQAYEKRTHGDVLSIAHNGNLANGIMFPLEAQFNGKKLDEDYVSLRAMWEPLYEITQIKGDGEAHPYLSPDDEFADYETWDVGNLDVSRAKKPEMLAGEYAREALKRGLVLEAKLGANPYKFGFIGSTDSHTSLATAQEDNFFGKHTGYEPSPTRMNHDMISGPGGKIEGWQPAASGLAAVWAQENTRESIFDAMERKEVYGTTGSRMAVRFFGGWDFVDADIRSREPAFAGYARGVPMGSDLNKAPAGAKAPSFMVYALKDPIGANLDRIQIIKGWLDDQGATHEKVYDVVWAGDRKIGQDGKLPPVGNTVIVEKATYSNSIGTSELAAVWSDQDFDPEEKAFYYVRVLEIPTPRWSTYDAFRYGIDIPEAAPKTTQERGYTSPIWYNPGS